MKRLLDIVLSVAGILVLSPLFLVLILLVWVKMGAPVFFRQSRAGQGGKPFEILKFRSMNSATDGAGQLLPDADRLTGFGQLLRSTSLDELPELWNVLCGEMSLVGPRPLPVRYLDRYSPEQMRRHEVRPGITGWAQINGRNAQTWEERFNLDVWYVENHTLWLDLKILSRTILTVLKREGISAEGEATMREFMGTNR